MKYVNIHTHHLAPKNSSIDVEEIFICDPRKKLTFSDSYCVGLHPWYINDVDLDELLSQILGLYHNPAFFALGEIGIDRTVSIDINLQKAILDKQLQFAKNNKISRVIIHNVRATSDILEVLKKVKFKGKVLFHDFNGNLEEAREILKYDAYFGFGAKLFNLKSQAPLVIKELPIERIFFETDDQTEIPIQDMYKQGAFLRQMPIEDLKKQIWQNFVQF